MPRDVLAKNFLTNEASFSRMPKEEGFIFKAPLPLELKADAIVSAQGSVPNDMKFSFTQQQTRVSPGGRVRIADSRNFPVSTEIAAALVEVDPGHIRELHWHPNADEWQYYIAGKGRMGVFGAQTRARTFDYKAGDVGTVPKAMAHYVENTGEGVLRFLELFRARQFMDVSLAQWMALTPHELVEAHLNIDRQLLEGIRKQKQPIV